MLLLFFLCKFAPMKKIGLLILLYILIAPSLLKAQEKVETKMTDSISVRNQDQLTLPADSVILPVDTLLNSVDSLAMLKSKIKKPKDVFDRKDLPNTYAWKITPRLGERILVERDTSYFGFNQRNIVDGYDVAMQYQANIGSAAQTKIFFNRPEKTRFIFLDNYSYWHKKPGDQLFLNTKKPYSNIHYQSGGGKQNKEERFMAEMSSNFGKKINVGFNFDYIYARGFYSELANKGLTYNLYGSYIGDRYKLHVYVANNNFTAKENGGITDDRYITNPVGDFSTSSSKDIPVNLKDTWNKMRGRTLYATSRYDLGKDYVVKVVDDTTVTKVKKVDYISPASVIFTTHYTDQRRRIHTANPASMNKYYTDSLNYLSNVNQDINNGEIYLVEMDDQMAYWSYKNTLALAMNEGFKPWMKFGLTAFVEYDVRKYALAEVTRMRGAKSVHGDNALNIGGVLSKEQGEFFFFRVSAEKNLLAGDLALEGEFTGKVKIFGKDISAKAKAYVKNQAPTFFEKHFGSKYFKWDRSDLKDVNRVFIGGELTLPSLSFSKTKISGGVENVKNYIYYGEDRLVAQSEKNVQIVSLRIDQDFQAGILHWDNQVVFQGTTDDEIIPLPSLSVFSNLYLSANVAKALYFQLGFDVHYHTKYYAPGYEPITMQFYNQREKKIGNFPIATGYINLNLKNTRFFIQMYNVLSGVMEGNAFTMPNYPVNPRVLKFGLSWKFNN